MKGGKGGRVEETGLQRQQAQMAQVESDDYREIWAPLEREFEADIKDTAPEKDRAQGVSALETTSAFAGLRDRVDMGNRRAGAHAGSGRFSLGAVTAGNEEALARASGAVDAASGVEDRKTAGLQSIVARGRGQRGEAVGGLGRLADRSAQMAEQRAFSNQSNRQAMQGAALSLAGAGAAASVDKWLPDEADKT